MTNQVPPILSGQDISAAARATRSFLDRALRRAGTTYSVYATMNIIRNSASAPSRRTLRDGLATGLQVDARAADEVLDRMTADGLLRWSPEAPDPEGAQVELTTQGGALHQRYAEVAAETADWLWRGFDPADLETTRRVLLEVTSRVKAELTA